MTATDVRFFFGRFSRASVALVCAGFSAFVLALCIAGGIHFKRNVEAETYRETGNIALMLMAGFDDDAAIADAVLSRLATAIPESEVSPEHEADLHRLLASYALQADMIGPAILDRSGMLIANARVETVPKVSFAERSSFRVHAQASGETGLYINTPTRSLFTNEWSIQFSRALREPSGALYGVVILSYRLSHFVRLFEKLKLSARGLVGLTGKDGVVRIRLLNGEISYGASLSKQPLVFNRVLAGETHGTFYGRNIDDVTRIGSFVVSPKAPFFVTVGYDTADLRARYMGFFYALGLCWLVLTAAMIAAAAFVHRLGKLARQAELEIVQSAAAERQKISADMHDSIGASLAALLAYCTTGNIDMAIVKRRVGEILMELRFLVDSAETEGGGIDYLLSAVRHRLASGIELAGIDLSWQIGELPKIALAARDALAIKLILMEALSNVLHHSRARTASLTANYDRAASAIVIAVHDDGRGFDPADASFGRGLSNMRRRTASISTGAAFAIESAPGRGTTVRLTLHVPPPA